MVLVSVIVPTYNRTFMLKQAIQSIQHQTFNDFEIIVVDDGSTEDIRAVTAEFGEKVRYERLERGGVSRARNHGIRVAQGRFVAFLDSDDLFLPVKLQKQVALLEQHRELGMVYSAYISVDENLNPLKQLPAPEYADGYTAMLTACTIATPTVMVRRDVFERVGVFDETMHLAEDIDLWCRISRFFPIAPIHEPLTKVRLHSSGTPRHPEAVLNAYVYLLGKAFRADPSITWSERRRMLARVHYICAAELLAGVDLNSSDQNRYKPYLYYHLKAARYYPFSRLGFNILWSHYTRFPRRMVQAITNRFVQMMPCRVMQNITNRFVEMMPHSLAEIKAKALYSLAMLYFKPIRAWLKFQHRDYVYKTFGHNNLFVLLGNSKKPIPDAYVQCILDKIPIEAVRNRALKALTQEDLESLSGWIIENIPHDYKQRLK
jgi:glycosyltransferase involved in cell wall biosynthesis